MRKILNESKVAPKALESIAGFYAPIISETEQAIQSNEWVVIGMAHNIPVKNARKFLKERNINYKYIEYGNYFNGWKLRLAIKLWSGWPTFPQVFHNGILVGGSSDLKAYLASK
jgi:monothiol glutaredoxin